MDTQYAQRAREHAERGTAGATAFAILDLADAIRAHGQPAPVETFDPETAGNVARARELAEQYAIYDGEHHKQHALVQIAELLGVRIPADVNRGVPL